MNNNNLFVDLIYNDFIIRKNITVKHAVDIIWIFKRDHITVHLNYINHEENNNLKYQFIDDVLENYSTNIHAPTVSNIKMLKYIHEVLLINGK
jgi:hypothetical protein